MAASNTKTAMDPTRKKQLKPYKTPQISPPDPVSSSTIKKITTHYAKWNSNHESRAVSKALDPPRIDAQLQAKAMTVSFNGDPSIKPFSKKPQKQSNLSTEMETQEKKSKEKEKKISRERNEPKRPSISHVNDNRRNSFCDSKIELGEFFTRLCVKVVAVDMPPFMQIHAVSCARKTYDGLDKFTSKTLACTLKKEFDGVYGPAWHCIVGNSFGSFVTHSVGGFLYFSMDLKLYILLFKTTVQRAVE